MDIGERVLTRNQRLAFELIARGEPLVCYEQGYGNHRFIMARVRSTGWHIGSYVKGLRTRKWIRVERDNYGRPHFGLTQRGWYEFARMQIEWPAAINWDYRSEPPVNEATS